MIAAEQAPQLGFLEPQLQRTDLLVGFSRRLVVPGFLGQLEQNLGIREQGLGLAKELDLALEPALVAQQVLSAFAVIPERRIARLLVQLV